MQGKAIFLTGGTGFFGKSILQRLIDIKLGVLEPLTLTVLSRNPEAFLKAYPQFRQPKFLSFVQGDIRTFDFPDEKFDYIIHAATPADARLDQENPEEMQSIIVGGTQHVLDFAKRCSCKRFLMVSSGAVYGRQPPDLLTLPESFPCQPVTAYGKGKLVAEELCIKVSERYGFETLLPRCFAFVGPYLPLDVHFAIGNFIRDCLDHQPIVIQGDGTPFRSYLYTDDLVDWLFKILLQGTHARPYNVGTDQALSIVDLAHLVKKCAGSLHKVIVSQAPIEGRPAVRYVPSIERVKNELGLTPTIGLQEAIHRTIAYHVQRSSQ